MREPPLFVRRSFCGFEGKLPIQAISTSQEIYHPLLNVPRD